MYLAIDLSIHQLTNYLNNQLINREKHYTKLGAVIKLASMMDVNFRLREGESGPKEVCNCLEYLLAICRSSETATVELRPVGGRPVRKSNGAGGRDDT